MSENKKALVSKLVEVLKSSEAVKKSGKNKHLGFDYSLESDITEVIKKNLIKQNLFVFTSIEEVNKVDQLTTCKLKITFMDGSTGEEYSVYSYGQGCDGRDFGLGKSVTNAFKMMWTKNFLLTGEVMDIENDSDVQVKEQPKKVEVKVTSNTKPTTTDKYTVVDQNSSNASTTTTVTTDKPKAKGLAGFGSKPKVKEEPKPMPKVEDDNTEF